MAELEARAADTLRRINEIRKRLPHAEAEYRVKFARWHEDAKGLRPGSSVAELEELQDDRVALEALVDEALAEKVARVEANRKGLVRDAEQRVAKARVAYIVAIDGLEQAREKPDAARRDELWIQLFPDPSATTQRPAAMLVGGIVTRLRSVLSGLSITFGMSELRRLLEADAEFVASMQTPEQERALRARHPELERAERGAIWVQTDEGQQALAQERREALERYRQEWATTPRDGARRRTR